MWGGEATNTQEAVQAATQGVSENSLEEEGGSLEPPYVDKDRWPQNSLKEEGMDYQTDEQRDQVPLSQPSNPFRFNVKVGLGSLNLLGVGMLGALLELETPPVVFDNVYWFVQLGSGSRNLWKRSQIENPYFMAATGVKIGHVWTFSLTPASVLYSFREEKFRYSLNISIGRWFRYPSFLTHWEVHLTGLNGAFRFPYTIPYIVLSVGVPLGSF